MLGRVVAAAVVAGIALVEPARADFFSEYLDGKTFGDDPGPCPFQDGTCAGSIQDLPDSVKAIEVCLDEDNQGGCGEIGDVVPRGDFEIWELQCDNVRVNDIRLSHVLNGAGTKLDGTIDVTAFKLSCTGRIRIVDLELSLGGFGILTTIEGDFALDQDSTEPGVTLELGIDFFAETGTTFSTDLPEFLRIPYEECDIDPQLGLDLTLDNGDFEALSVLLGSLPISVSFFINILGLGPALLNAIILIAEAVLGGIICQLAEEAALLEATGDPGILNIVWTEIRDQVEIWAQSVGEDVAFADSDANLLSKGITQAEIDASIDLAESALVEGLSAGLNGFLGAISDSPGYVGRLVVNEFVDRVTEPDGELAFDLVELGADLEVTVPINITDVTVRLERVKLGGLSSFETFQILDNNYNDIPANRFKRTFSNNFELSSFSLEVDAYVLLERGNWVTESCNFPGPTNTCPPGPLGDSSEFTFSFSIDVADVNFDASLLTLVDPDNLDELQVGQLTDIDFEADAVAGLSNAVTCLSPAFYAINVTDLTASIGPISNPQLVNFDGTGLSNLISDSISFGADLVKGALQTKFPGIANGPIRETINDAFLLDVTAPGRLGTPADCLPWQGPTGLPPSPLDFDSALFEPVLVILNEGLGGNPITDTGADINELFDALLNFYADTFPEDFPLQTTGQGSWGLTQTFKDTLEAPPFVPSGPDVIAIRDIRITNLDSIYRLEAASPNQGLDIVLGLGGELQPSDGSPATGTPNPLVIVVDLEVVQTSSGTNERAELIFNLEELDLGITLEELVIDFDFFNAIQVKNLGNVACLLSTLDRAEFPELARTVSLSALTFSVNSLVGPNVGTPLGSALNTLAGETPSDRAKALVTTLIDVGLNAVLDAVEAVPEDFADLTPVTCLLEEDPLGSVTVLLSLDLPNVTEFQEVCLADIEPLPPVGASELVVTNGEELPDILNFLLSPLTSLLQGAFELTKGSTLENVLVALANSTVVPILELDPTSNATDPKVDLVLDLETFGFLIDFSDNDPGFKFSVGTLRAKSVNKLLNSLELFEPIGKYTLRNTIELDAGSVLDVEIVSTLQIDAEAAGEGPGIIEENITTKLEVNEFSLEAETVLGINTKSFGELAVGHLLDIDENQNFVVTDYAVDCLLSVLYPNGIFFRKLEISLTDVTNIEVTTGNEIVSPGVEALLGAIIDIVADFYQAAVTNISQNCVRTFVNEFLEESRAVAADGGCPPVELLPPVPLSGQDRIFRFNTAQIITDFLDLWFEEIVDNDYDPLEVVLDASVGATTYLPKNPNEDESLSATLPLLYNGVNYGTVFAELSNIKVNNNDPFLVDELRLLVPYGGNGEPLYPRGPVPVVGDRRQLGFRRELQATIPPEDIPYMTETTFVNGGPLVLEFDLTFNSEDLFEDFDNLVNNVNVKLTVEDLVFGIQFFLALDLVKFHDTRFNSITSLEEIPCALVPVEAFRPTDFNLSTSAIDLELSCIGTCDLPFLKPLETGPPFKTTNGDTISTLFDNLIEFGNEFVASRDFQNVIDASIATAESDCERLLEIAAGLVDLSLSEKDDVASIFLYIFLGGAAIAGVGAFFLLPLHKTRRKRTLALNLQREDVVEGEKIGGALALTELKIKSIFAHPITPVGAKYFVPFILVMNVVGLVVAIVFSEAANIIIQVTVLDATTRPVVLVPFTLASTINDTWNSGAWPLALLIVIASCMWPVVKNLMLLFFWFAPATVCSVEKRHRILEILDLLGKWSFLDVYVIVVTLAALRVYVTGAFYVNLAFLDEQFFIADVNVTPENGIVLLCFVAAVSLVINHVIIYFHNQAEESNRIIQDKINGLPDTSKKVPARAAVRRSVITHVFAGTTRDGGVRTINQFRAKVLLGVGLIAMVCIVVGISLPVITFELNGLIGLLLEEISRDSPQVEGSLATKTYSVLSMGSTLNETPTASSFEIIVNIFFQFLFAVSIYIGPLVLLTVILFLFTLPVSLGNLRAMYFWTKIASYWAALEVFIVAMFFTILEISVVTQFIVDFITNDLCGNVSSLIAFAVDDPDTDAFCLDVVGNLESGFAILSLGLVLELTVFLVASTVAFAVYEDRYFVSYRNLRDNVVPKKRGTIGRAILRMMTVIEHPKGVQRDGEVPVEIGPFSALDADDNDLVNGNASCTEKLFFCCSIERGQSSAEARVMAWEKRFAAVTTPYEPPARESSFAPVRQSSTQMRETSFTRNSSFQSSGSRRSQGSVQRVATNPRFRESQVTRDSDSVDV
ncbi:Intermembrane transport protein PqiA [Durusdinium trenchii]|uniref:Intermembrane transport protein PqiA n=1 Tax=Durusdinium trenchii TaxID=1381693 RepID=A0ABP0P706_9DINO